MLIEARYLMNRLTELGQIPVIMDPPAAPRHSFESRHFHEIPIFYHLLKKSDAITREEKESFRELGNIKRRFGCNTTFEFDVRSRPLHEMRENIENLFKGRSLKELNESIPFDWTDWITVDSGRKKSYYHIGFEDKNHKLLFYIGF